jgi:hypothetical protein
MEFAGRRSVWADDKLLMTLTRALQTPASYRQLTNRQLQME